MYVGRIIKVQEHRNITEQMKVYVIIGPDKLICLFRVTWFSKIG